VAPTIPLEAPCRLCGARDGVRAPDGPRCAVCDWRVGDAVDDGLPLPRVDVVYYLRLGERVKIGTTFAPRQRFAALPHDEVLAFEPGDRMLERQRHREFAADRLGTSEWFALSPGIRAHVATVRGDAAGAWQQWARLVSSAYRER
jgi:hypothetical protein